MIFDSALHYSVKGINRKGRRIYGEVGEKAILLCVIRAFYCEKRRMDVLNNEIERRLAKA